MNPTVTEATARPQSEGNVEDAARRMMALKKLQLMQFQSEQRMEADIQMLKAKYTALNQQITNKRAAIVNGSYDPTGEDCQLEHPGVIGRYDSTTEETQPLQSGYKGIPGFWLTVLKNDDYFEHMIRPHDEDALKSLVDIKVVMNETNFNFAIEFHFAANDYFINDKLTKTYEIKCDVPSGAPFNYIGREIVKTHGCIINWKLNKDLTKQAIGRKSGKSFFNIFGPVTENGNGVFDDYEEDYEFGKHVARHTVADAVLYFTGEILGEDEDEDESDTSEEESDTEDSSD